MGVSVGPAAGGDEGETAGAAAHAVHHQVGFKDGAMIGESVLKIVFGGVEGKISNVQFITHVCDVLPITLYLKPVPDHRA